MAIATATQGHRGVRKWPSGKSSGTPTITAASDGTNARLATSPTAIATGSFDGSWTFATSQAPLPISAAKPTAATRRIGPMGFPGTRVQRNVPKTPNASGNVTYVTMSIGVRAHQTTLAADMTSPNAITPRPIAGRRSRRRLGFVLDVTWSL